MRDFRSLRRNSPLFFATAIPEVESLLLLDQKKDQFELTGPGYLIHEAGGFKFRVSHLSFFQVNRFLIEDLLKTVTAGAKGKLALDLYSGVGFFYVAAGAGVRKSGERGCEPCRLRAIFMLMRKLPESR